MFIICALALLLMMLLHRHHLLLCHLKNLFPSLHLVRVMQAVVIIVSLWSANRCLITSVHALHEVLHHISARMDLPVSTNKKYRSNLSKVVNTDKI